MITMEQTIVRLLVASGGQDLGSITREVRIQYSPDIAPGEAGRVAVYSELRLMAQGGIVTREWMEPDEDIEDGTGYHYWELTDAGYALAATYP